MLPLRVSAGTLAEIRVKSPIWGEMTPSSCRGWRLPACSCSSAGKVVRVLVDSFFPWRVVKHQGRSGAAMPGGTQNLAGHGPGLAVVCVSLISRRRVGWVVSHHLFQLKLLCDSYLSYGYSQTVFIARP